MIGIFTTSNGRVRSIHYQLEKLPVDRVPDLVLEGEGDLPKPPVIDEDHQAFMCVKDGVVVYEVEERLLSDEEIRDRALRLASRLAIIDLARQNLLDENLVDSLLPLFPVWNGSANQGEWYSHKGFLYECLQSTSKREPANDFLFWRRYPWTS